MIKLVLFFCCLLVFNFNHKLRNVCKHSIGNEVIEFENKLKVANFKIDSMDLSYRNSREVNGLIYFISKRYTAIVYTDQHFYYKDTSLYDSLINTKIVHIILQKSKKEDIEVFE